MISGIFWSLFQIVREKWWIILHLCCVRTLWVPSTENYTAISGVLDAREVDQRPALCNRFHNQYNRTPESPLGPRCVLVFDIRYPDFFSEFYLDSGGYLENFGPYPEYDIYLKKKSFFFFFDISVLKSVPLVLRLFIIIFRYAALHYLDGGEKRNINLLRAINV